MSFDIALTGLNAASRHLDVTANNIANVGTTGFKRSKAVFSDVFASSLTDASNTQTGAGVKLAKINQQFSQGNVTLTNNNLDLAINGDGFFTLSSVDQGLVYSRAGEFSLDKEGFVVNTDLNRLQIFPATTGGNFATGTLQDLQLKNTAFPPKPSSTATVGLNLPSGAIAPAVAPFDPSNLDTFSHNSSMTVYDSQGASHSASMYFVKDAAPNSWSQYLFIDGNAVGGANTLQFDGAGLLQAPANGVVTLPPYTPTNGAGPINLSIDFSDSTQYGNDFVVNNLAQDGFESGILSGLAIDSNGVVSARYSNQASEQLGKIALTGFNNPQGLQQLGANTWAETFTAGDPRLGEPGTSNFGLIQSSALESSNVDLSAELVEMVTAQRNYQANAQVISTSDQITQAILNIR
ncbi:flagellar hook protein FlgE [Litorivivens sp.]|uniref:flagellar hook protein FlgE n=1 Tax=Litorivivens sp. TaxID=2020868 RepID=UPI003564150E